MDVRCERCGTEYEFDETKVTQAGVTVKCAQCGHLFKVRRRSEASAAKPLPAPPIVTSSGERMWMVRDPRNGEIQRFRELTTLQQWIVEQRVSRDHEISRTGEIWKPLGEIAELASFFQVVDLAVRSGQTPNPPARPSPPALPSSSAQGTLDPTPSPPPWQPSAPEPSYTTTRVEPPPTQPYAPAPSYGNNEVPVQRSVAEGPVAFGAMPHPSPDPRFAGNETAPDGYDDYTPAVPKRRGFRIAVLVIAGVAVGLGAFLARNPLRALFGGKSQGLSEAMIRGRESFLTDTDDGYIQADHQFQRAQGTNPGSPKPLAALSEVYSIWAMYLREDARLLDAHATKVAQPGDAAALRARAEEKRREADQKLQQAELSAKEALSRGVDDPDVNRAYSMMQVVKGTPAAEVERFVGKASGGTPETLFVEGALLLREQRTDEARRVLEDALARSGDQPPARVQYLLARTNETLGRKEVAKEILGRLLRQNAKHDRAKALLDSLAAEPPAAAPPTPAPAPAPTPPPVNPPSTLARDAPVAPSSKTGPAAAPAPEPGTPASYDQLVDKGNKLLEKGQDTKARAAFDEALKQRPQGPEAQTGLGNFYVSAGKMAMAILYFQKAADNGYGEALFYLAEAQRSQGAAAEALANYRKYLSHGAHGENVGIAQRAIHDLVSKAEAPAPAPPEEKSRVKDLPPEPVPSKKEEPPAEEPKP
jgi:predicted Zn finger-like uncharacterized protein